MRRGSGPNTQTHPRPHIPPPTHPTTQSHTHKAKPTNLELEPGEGGLGHHALPHQLARLVGPTARPGLVLLLVLVVVVLQGGRDYGGRWDSYVCKPTQVSQITIKDRAMQGNAHAMRTHVVRVGIRLLALLVPLDPAEHELDVPILGVSCMVLRVYCV